MRYWVLFIVISSLLILPFSGSMSAMASQVNISHQPVPSEAQHSNHSKDTDHCATLMYGDKAEKNKVDTDKIAEHHDCCDSVTPCTSCQDNCGHCVVAGHGFLAAFSIWRAPVQPAILKPLANSHSYYQLLIAQPSPPPKTA